MAAGTKHRVYSITCTYKFYLSQRPLWLMAIGLSATTILMCATMVLALSHSERRILQKLSLGLCEGVPCFVGIVPGRTSWASAGALAVAGWRHWTDADGSNLIFKPDAMNSPIHLYQSATGDTVGTISINPLRDSLAIGEIINAYGPPSCVHRFGPPINLVVFHYPSLQVLVDFTGHHLSPVSMVRSILLVGANQQQGGSCNTMRYGEGGNGDLPQPWNNFADLNRSIR
jgi:hypothetical protein